MEGNVWDELIDVPGAAGEVDEWRFLGGPGGSVYEALGMVGEFRELECLNVKNYCLVCGRWDGNFDWSGQSLCVLQVKVNFLQICFWDIGDCGA